LYSRCAQIGLGRGAREGVYPQRYSTDRATKPQANSSATRRAACLLGGGVVARSSQIHFGICSGARAEAPRAWPPPKIHCRECMVISETPHEYFSACVHTRNICPIFCPRIFPA